MPPEFRKTKKAPHPVARDEAAVVPPLLDAKRQRQHSGRAFLLLPDSRGTDASHSYSMYRIDSGPLYWKRDNGPLVQGTARERTSAVPSRGGALNLRRSLPVRRQLAYSSPSMHSCHMNLPSIICNARPGCKPGVCNASSLYIVHLRVMYYDEVIHIIYMFLNHICDLIGRDDCFYVRKIRRACSPGV